ncbi:glycosyltransferase [Lutibacter sp. A64]|uniref:glycosyltransferase family 2 protein n=1 Tax=Lutibacter sp. A64 TaxID=2918526 RepID=UPI001F052657|nr:glycosyltransferase family 2 protein [Lutibacter sp. A64]UMB55469.1 glycosyltransferase [Lutibacter sp. A64]
MIKISIIIPVYNAEKYLKQCIQSVLNQSFTNFELLLINDGSKDKSGVICNSYAANDKRVSVFHKKNGGVSSARNLGLKNAVGEWITFIDSDDFISENYFQPILDFDKHDYIIMDSYIIKDDVKSFYNRYEPKSLILNEFLNQYNLFRDFGSPWGKFFRKSIIFENKIGFDEKLDKGEDVVFNLTYVLKCKMIGISNSTSYNYRIVSNSLSSKKSNVKHSEYLYSKIFNLLESYSQDLEFISKHNSLSALVYFFNVLYSDYSKIKKKKILKELIKKHKNQLVLRAKGQSIHLIPLTWIIKHELIALAILITNIRKV